MLDTLTGLDADLLLRINGAHAPYWDSFMWLYTGRWVWIPMYAAILWAVCRSYPWRAALTVVVAVALCILLADQTCATLIRPIVARPRPTQDDSPIHMLVHVVNGYRGGHYGFPSCHGVNSYALATFMSLLMVRRRWVIFMLAWATLNCYTRLYLGVHYPGDIIVGGIIGATLAALLYLAAMAVIGRMRMPGGFCQTPPLRSVTVAGHEVYYRSFDIPIAVGVLTVAVIAISALFV